MDMVTKWIGTIVSIAQVIECVKQKCQPALEILEDFRLVVNDCIRIGLKQNIASMRRLSLVITLWVHMTWLRTTASRLSAEPRDTAKRNDVRIRSEIYAKYGAIQRN